MLRDLRQDGLQDVNDGNGATMQMIWMTATMQMIRIPDASQLARCFHSAQGMSAGLRNLR